MAAAVLAFDIIARDMASGTFRRVGAEAGATGPKIGKLGAAIGGLALLDAGAHMIKMAGDFQQSTNVLVTAAGETQANLGMVRKGILDIAKGTGAPIHELTDGMYQIEKAGFRGADGLNILKAASQAAREEGANLATVTNAATSVMASYHLKAGDAVMVMNEMKTAAGESKTTMEQFAGSLSTVLPIASANGISFAKIAGSLASLTQHGTSADEAAQELANTMRNLAAPNMVAIKEMGQLGISSQDVSQKLGERGVAGTLNYLSETVLRKMGPSGKVLLSTFLQSQSAGQGVTQMLQAMEPETRKWAEQFAKGSIIQEDWSKALKGMTPQQASLARQFAVAENRARGFNTAIRQGMPGSQTYTEAIKKMTGGANGLNTTLQLTGESTAGTTERIKRIADAAKDAGKDVQGWDSTQKLFNVQLDRFKQTIAAAAIELGGKLLPVATKFVSILADHQKALEVVVALLGAMAAKVVIWKVAELGALVATKAWSAALTAQKIIMFLLNGQLVLATVRFYAYEAALIVTSVATKAWAAAQWLLNAALDANPIGIVVVALGALVVGLIYAWKHSETFRNIVKGAFHLLAVAVGNYIGTMVKAFKFLADVWMEQAHLIIHGAALMFGWVPGVGPKLRQADHAFSAFRDGVNRHLTDIQNKAYGIGNSAPKALADGITRNTPAATAASSHLRVSVDNVLRMGAQDGYAAGRSTATQVGSGIRSRSAAAAGAGGVLASNVREHVGHADDNAHAVGAAVGDGVASGIHSRYGTVRAAMVGLLEGLKTIPSFGLLAGHVPGFAGGVSNYHGGVALVGERGPELVDLPRGSSVTPAGPTAAALSAGKDRGSDPMLRVLVDAVNALREETSKQNNRGLALARSGAL